MTKVVDRDRIESAYAESDLDWGTHPNRAPSHKCSKYLPIAWAAPGSVDLALPYPSLSMQKINTNASKIT